MYSIYNNFDVELGTYLTFRKVRVVEVGEEAATEGPRRQDQRSEHKAQRQLVLSS